MRGHEVIEWEPTPERLFIWALRVAAFDARPCPGLVAALLDKFGAAAPTIVSLAQETAFSLARLEPLDAPLHPPFVSHFSEAEKRIAHALQSGSFPNAWQGPAAALIRNALGRFRRACEEAEAPYPAAANARAAS